MHRGGFLQDLTEAQRWIQYYDDAHIHWERDEVFFHRIILLHEIKVRSYNLSANKMSDVITGHHVKQKLIVSLLMLKLWRFLCTIVMTLFQHIVYRTAKTDC